MYLPGPADACRLGFFLVAVFVTGLPIVNEKVVLEDEQVVELHVVEKTGTETQDAIPKVVGKHLLHGFTDIVGDVFDRHIGGAKTGFRIVIHLQNPPVDIVVTTAI
jgi:hypothetical protein